MQDTMTNAWFHQLKAANRLLIKKNGGIEAAAESSSLSKSQIGRCHSDADTELLPISAVLRLEAECGDAVVTRAMAALHGCKLTDPRATATDGGCLLRESLELSSLSNEYQRNFGRNVADLKMTPAELREGLRDLARMGEKMADLTKLYTVLLAQGGGEAPALKIVAGE